MYEGYSCTDNKEGKEFDGMKKIGIITIDKVNNYGAELQTLATQKAVEKLGYEAEIIDYLFYKNPGHKVTKCSKPLFPLPFKKHLTEWLYPRLNLLRQLTKSGTEGKKRAANFEAFHKKHTKFSKEYRTAEELYAAKMDYDVYVVGSDQVWNPNNYTSLDPYFLKFAPKEKRRISYASSIGVSTIPEYARNYYKEALQDLDAVSVREEDAVGIVKEVSGVDAHWVLDPTLLLTGEEWKKYYNPISNIPEKFVLLYEITPCDYLKQLALKASRELGCPVVRINREAIRQESDDEIINVLDAGPSEFVWLFANAQMVLTNSFHGTAFSLNMEKNFFVVTPERKKNNSRQKSILRLVGLEDRLIVENAPMPSKENYDIDYNTIRPKLEKARQESMDYLKNAIDGTK